MEKSHQVERDVSKRTILSMERSHQIERDVNNRAILSMEKSHQMERDIKERMILSMEKSVERDQKNNLIVREPIKRNKSQRQPMCVVSLITKSFHAHPDHYSHNIMCNNIMKNAHP